MNNTFHTKDISNDSFLVTGAAGFIGGHIAEYLLKSGAKKVRVLDVLATVVNKITFKKVHIQTAYSPQGQLVAYSVSAGTLNYEIGRAHV